MTTSEPTRKPPIDVRRALRQEVGFGCPIEGCGIPYLEYHHFDPPWAIEKHHDPERMIALCATHHAQADSLTVLQCRELKRVDRKRPDIGGRFMWMREEIIAVVGGNYFFDVTYPVTYSYRPVCRLRRDEQGRVLLSCHMVSLTPEKSSAKILDNDWLLGGSPVSVDSPPKGDRLTVQYASGDEFSVRFREHHTSDGLYSVYPRLEMAMRPIVFPVATVEFNLKVGGMPYVLSATGSTFPSGTVQGNIFYDRPMGFDLSDPNWFMRL